MLKNTQKRNIFDLMEDAVCHTFLESCRRADAKSAGKVRNLHFFRCFLPVFLLQGVTCPAQFGVKH